MDEFNLAFCFSLRELAYLNTLKTRQNDRYRHFVNPILTLILLNGNILIDFLPKCLLRGPLNNTLALPPIVARRKTGDKPISHPKVASICFEQDKHIIRNIAQVSKENSYHLE